MARIDDLLEIDSAPAVAEVDANAYSLAASCDAFADALADLSETFADIDFAADSFKVQWLAIGSGSSSFAINVNDLPVVPNGGDITITFDAGGVLSPSFA